MLQTPTPCCDYTEAIVVNLNQQALNIDSVTNVVDTIQTNRKTQLTFNL